MTSLAPDDVQAQAADVALAGAEVAFTPGGWLRRQRRACGWAVPEMARQLREVAKVVGDPLPEHDALVSMIRRWERGAGVSERYRLHYCRAFGLPAEKYGIGGPTPDYERADPPAEPVRSGELLPVPAVPPGRFAIAPPAAVAYGGIQEPGQCGSWITREVLMAAHDSSEHAERVEHREIGDVTLEQLRTDVIRLSREFMSGELLSLLLEMRRLRERMHAALDRRLWPRDEAELYLLLGCLTDLTSAVALDLGYRQAAEDLIRAGWAYATVIDHKPLMARLRLQLASICFWDNQPLRAMDLAADGLHYLNDGPTAAELHLHYARSASCLGDRESAQRAIAEAADARERDHDDEVTKMGGEFALSLASQSYFAGFALAELDDALDEAARELDEAARLYALGPESGEQHGFGVRAMTDVGRATVRLRAGGLDGAAAVLKPVLSLPRGQRIAAVTTQLGRVRSELAAPIYRGSAQARELDERIEEFCRQTVVTDLHALPAGL